MKLKRGNKPQVIKWRDLSCSCGCDHLESYQIGKTVRVYVDMDKCTCPKGTQHPAMLAETKAN